MNNFKLKLILTILSSIIFSFIFILLALVLPTTSEKTFNTKPKGLLQAVSQSIKE
ncbi:hypothetical protein HUE87_07665 [Candidatus Sulfurimonas marisnigri]|uniref:Uncharacterized protein n=1 Tax=Candidatus Sulfurimonas marisnigri TaxID=2740405 RepID=A0A7S7LYH9_9BACT|nr:hypothetical protein [Candidatus Sulfurimonas marisnigri]QOY53777.1 hypothetical protein HUE87_07665 [Candidatus Sulfurimonas marisnigri]